MVIQESPAKPARAPLLDAIALRFVAPCLLLVLLVLVIAPPAWLRDTGKSDDLVIERIGPVAALEIVPPVSSASMGQRSGEVVALTLCQSCHINERGGAPKIGSRKDWAQRMNQGLDSMVRSASAGKCALARQGGSDASDMELARAIVYMIWPRMRL